MKMDPGNTVIYQEENGSLKSGVFVGFTDLSERKAMIFLGSGYKTITTEKLIRVTVPQLEVLADQIRNQLKLFRKRNREVVPELSGE